MKKTKFVLLGLMLIFLLGFSLILVPVGVKANSYIERWDAPESAKNFRDKDGKGVRLYVSSVYADDQGNLEYVLMIAIKTYEFNDGTKIYGRAGYFVGTMYFDITTIDLLVEYLNTYGSGRTIYSTDLSYFYFDVDSQKFQFEYRGLNYAGYLLEQYMNAFESAYDVGYTEGLEAGYNVGYAEGREVGYNEGYDVGYNETFSGTILLIALIMYILSMFLYFTFKIKWILIATILLWFVPIFLVHNMFVRIFSAIMIIVTIVITFFNDREEDYSE